MMKKLLSIAVVVCFSGTNVVGLQAEEVQEKARISTMNIEQAEDMHSRVSITVHFDANGGVFASGEEVIDLIQSGVNQLEQEPEKPIKTGYNFIGWNDQSDGSGNVYTSFSAGNNLYTGITLYATWSLVLDIPDVVEGESIARYVGEHFTFKPNIAGMVNNAWQFDSKHMELVSEANGIYTFRILVAGTTTMTFTSYDEQQRNITINAQSIEVIFDANEGVFPSNEKQIVWIKDTINSLPIGVGSPIREGYDFGGWNTKSDGSGLSYDAGTIATIGENTTVYAIWKRVPISPMSASKNPATGDTQQTSFYFVTLALSLVLGGALLKKQKQNL